MDFDISTIKVNKVALTGEDDKRIETFDFIKLLFMTPVKA